MYIKLVSFGSSAKKFYFSFDISYIGLRGAVHYDAMELLDPLPLQVLAGAARDTGVRADVVGEPGLRLLEFGRPALAPDPRRRSTTLVCPLARAIDTGVARE